MRTWTVITHLGPHGHDHIGAVAGHANAYGPNIHTTTVTHITADDAIRRVREAFLIAGSDRFTANTDTPPPADRWTVVGLADNGACATYRVAAVIPGEHVVEGRRESMLSHRWTEVVDAPTAADAEHAGYVAAAEQYDDTWN